MQWLDKKLLIMLAFSTIAQAAQIDVDVKGVQLVTVTEGKAGIVEVVVKALRKDQKALIPHHLLIMVDNSGSMQGKNFESVQRALAAIRFYLKESGMDLPLTLMSFDNDARVLFADKTTDEKLASFIGLSTTSPNGGTNFYPAVQLLKQKIELIKQQKDPATKMSAIPLVFFLTDGWDNSLTKENFAPLQGVQVELIGVSTGVNLALKDVATSLHAALHYLPDNPEAFFADEQNPLGTLAQVLLSRIKDVVSGPVTILATLPADTSAQFTGASWGVPNISNHGKTISLTIPSLADEEERSVQFYTNAPVQGPIHAGVMVNPHQKSSLKINETLQKQDQEHLFVGLFATELANVHAVPATQAQDLSKKLWAVQDTLNNNFPDLYEEMMDFSEHIALLADGCKTAEDIEKTKTKISQLMQDAFQTVLPGITLSQHPGFEKEFNNTTKVTAQVKSCTQKINNSQSLIDQKNLLAEFKADLERDDFDALNAELIKTADELITNFSRALGTLKNAEDGKNFITAALHNMTQGHVSNTPGASSGTKTQRSLKEKLVGATRDSYKNQGIDAKALDAQDNIIANLANVQLRKTNTNSSGKASNTKADDDNTSSSHASFNDIKARFQKKQ